MYHVFICYPRTYLAQVSPLHDALELALRNIYRRDAQVFQDTSDLEAVNKWESDVNTALEHARVMIVVVVPTILESPQCRREMLHFINTPGKHLVPLTCEAVPRLRQLADGVERHPEGSPEHEIAVCARALRTWQEFDFSKVIYQNPNDTAYKVAVAELARMIRNKLDQEDLAEAGQPSRSAGRTGEAGPRNETTDNSPSEVSAAGADATGAETGRPLPAETETGDGGSRRTLLLLALAGVLAAVAYGLWSWPWGGDPTEERLDRTRAQAILARAMTEAAGQFHHVTFDAEGATLRIAAPPVGSVATRIALQPGIDPLLKAGFVPGFAPQDGNDGVCFGVAGDPVMLTGDELADGEVVTLRLRLFERGEAPGEKVCVTPEPTWRRLEASNAIVDSGAILAAPRDDARELRTLRRGQQVPGPFWIHNEVPGWVRMEYRDAFAYLRRDLITELR